MRRIKLPGLIDPHVHLRDPGQTQKEDLFTGTAAALAGGFTCVLDMPNNNIPITSLQLLNEKIKEAKKKIVCDIGFYAGTVGEDLHELARMEPFVFGLKLYFNHTTGNFIIDKKKYKTIFSAWKSAKPILVHAEEDVLAQVLHVVKETGKRVHVCHVSNKAQLALIIHAKEQNLPVTCGVTPHHLFLTENDLPTLHSFGRMKPVLGTTADVRFLWKNMTYIDVIESDHAPHTIVEKEEDPAPFGVPGLETTLPLLLTAVYEKRITLERVIELCYTNSKKIFRIKTSSQTWSEIDLKETYTIDNKKLLTKCGWSPFHGYTVTGKVKQVILRGKSVFDDNNQLSVNPGFGKYLCPTN